MPLSERQLYDELCECAASQFDYIEEQLGLDSKFLDKTVAATRARELLKLLKQRKDSDWREKVEALLVKVKSGAEDYFMDRLSLIKKFLVEPPEAPNDSPNSAGTIKDLREKLEGVGKLQNPELIKVRGTLFPAALLTAGWWERKKTESKLNIGWKNPLQQWLFQGFDLWAPSWDISWDFEGRRPEMNPYCVAQLTDGDEADSLPVIVPAGKAKKLRDEFRGSWGGFEVEVQGMLGHRYQFDKKVPQGVKGEPLDYYISLEDDNKKHKITRLAAKTELYSGYLWKCIAPKEWMEGEKLLALDQVYFVWEHTNFAAKDAVAYNLDGLLHKEGLIAKMYPGSELVLLQKSHSAVPGVPVWDVQDFYHLLLGEKGEAI